MRDIFDDPRDDERGPSFGMGEYLEMQDKLSGMVLKVPERSAFCVELEEQKDGHVTLNMFDKKGIEPDVFERYPDKEEAVDRMREIQERNELFERGNLSSPDLYDRNRENIMCVQVSDLVYAELLKDAEGACEIRVTDCGSGDRWLESFSYDQRSQMEKIQGMEGSDMAAS